MKASGLGRRHGADGILRYTEPQAIAVQRLCGITPPPGVTWEQFDRVLTMSLRALRRLSRP